MKLEITQEECKELMRLVDTYLEETRVEVRHTQNRDYRTQLQQEESVLRLLRDKLRQLAASEATPQAV